MIRAWILNSVRNVYLSSDSVGASRVKAADRAGRALACVVRLGGRSRPRRTASRGRRARRHTVDERPCREPGMGARAKQRARMLTHARLVFYRPSSRPYCRAVPPFRQRRGRSTTLQAARVQASEADERPGFHNRLAQAPANNLRSQATTRMDGHKRGREQQGRS